MFVTEQVQKNKRKDNALRNSVSNKSQAESAEPEA
jgi:hypothetical protein